MHIKKIQKLSSVLNNNRWYITSAMTEDNRRATTFLKEHKALIASYRSGVYCLNRHLNSNACATRSDTAQRLFGDQGKSKQVQLAMFPRFAALSTEEGALDALKADVSVLFVRVRSVATKTLTTMQKFVFDTPTQRAIADIETKRCSDFSERHNQARRELDQLDKLCDEILWFTQLASRYDFAVPVEAP